MKKSKNLILVIFFCLFMFFSACKTDDQNFEYAIIFYPDHRTSVEGYIDNYVLTSTTAYVTINGEQYITSIDNVVIIKKKDLVINKEDTNEE